MKPIIKLIRRIREDLDRVESYINGRLKAADILENESKKDAAFYYDVEKKTFIIQDEDYSETMIEKIMNGEVKMDDIPTVVDKAIREEEESQLPKLKEGSISKRKDGRWQGRYYDNGTRKYLYARTKKEIIQILNKAIIERDKIARSRIISSNITLNKWIQEWINIYKTDIKPATRKDYETFLVKKMKNHPLGKKQVKFISSIELERYFITIDSPSSRARTFRHMKSCFTSLFKNKIIIENPFDIIKNIPEPRSIKFVPNQEQLNNFFDYLKIKNYQIYMFARFISLTGLRKGEALALTWNDITEDRIFIDKAWESTANKVQEPKTKSSIRSIPIFPGVKELLQDLPKETNEVFGFIYKKSVGHRFHEYVKKYGLNGLTLHSLRHYFTTQCLEIGVNDKVVQKWLGHSKITITRERYQHVKPKFETMELEKIAKFRGKKK